MKTLLDKLAGMSGVACSRGGWMVVGMLLLSMGSVGALEPKEVAQNPSAMFRSQAGTPQPNVTLPAHVLAPQGQLTCFADFANASADGVPVYLVNRTAQTVNPESQDQDLYFKLERKDADGNWQRAQTHFSSWCGNSYYTVELPAGQFLKFNGYVAKSGMKARVRYSCYGSSSLISNEGEVLVSDADIEASRYDSLAASAVPFSIRRMLEFRDAEPAEARGPGVFRVAALRLAQICGDNAFIKREALKMVRWLSDPDRNPTEDDKQAAGEMKRILDDSWPPLDSSKRLRDYCFAVLKAEKTDNAQYGAPENHRDLLIEVLGELSGKEFVYFSLPRINLGKGIDINEWRSLMDVMKVVIQSGSENQKSRVIQWLKISPLADEVLEDEFLEREVLSQNPTVSVTCAKTLSRRKRWDKLAKIGMRSSDKVQMTILRALAYPTVDYDFRNVKPREPESEVEKTFWAHCLVNHTLDAAVALQGDGNDAVKEIAWLIGAPIRKLLMKEIERSDGEKEEFEMKEDEAKLSLLVKIVGTWKLEKDQPLMKRLVSHRGYTLTQVGKFQNGEPFMSKRYPLRFAAEHALKLQETE